MFVLLLNDIVEILHFRLSGPQSTVQNHRRKIVQQYKQKSAGLRTFLFTDLKQSRIGYQALLR